MGLNARIASLLFAFLSFCQTAPGGALDATVRIQDGKHGCTGVCVSPDGLVVTAKHCEFAEGTKVTFRDGTEYEAEVVWQSGQGDGAAFMKLESDREFPWVPIADGPPRINDPLHSIGTQRDTGPIRADGHLKGVRNVKVMGSRLVDDPAGFPVNVVSFVAEPGWSGGPVFNAQGELLGIVLATGEETCVSSWSSLNTGYQTIPQQYRRSPKPELMVFTAPYCRPCQAWKDQYYQNPSFRAQIDAKYTVTFHDANQSYGRRYGFNSVPAFVVGGRTIHEGYTNESAFFRGVGIGVGVVVPPRPFLPPEPTQVIPGFQERQPPPEDDIDRVDWSAMTLVLAFNTHVPLRKESRSQRADRIEQRIRQATIDQGVPVNIRVISRVLDQESYDQFAMDAGFDGGTIHPVLLVPARASGVKGLVLGPLERALEVVIEKTSPLEVVTERNDRLRYRQLRADLYAYSPILPEDSDSPTGGLNAIQIVLLLLTALVVAKLHTVEMLMGIKERVRLPRVRFE